MIRNFMVLPALACTLLAASCATTEHPAPTYGFSATIWQALSAEQSLLTIHGKTEQAQGHLGHYLGEPVSITVQPLPSNAVTIGALSISSQTTEKCLPIKKWSKDGQTVYAICDLQASDRHAVVSIETESKTLTQPLLKELIEKFIPNKSIDGTSQ